MSDADRVSLSFTEEPMYGVPSTGSSELIFVPTGTIVQDDTTVIIKFGCAYIPGPLPQTCPEGSVMIISGTDNNDGEYEVISSTFDGTYTIICGADDLSDEPSGNPVTITCGYYSQSAETPKMNLVRFTSESLAQDSDFHESEEIQVNRNIRSVDRTQAKVSGQVAIEFSEDSFDTWLAMLLCSYTNFGQSRYLGQDLDVDHDVGELTFTETDWEVFNSIISVGDWVVITGNSNIQGMFRVTGIDNDNFILTYDDDSTAQGSLSNITIYKGTTLFNDTRLRSMAMQRTYHDISQYVFYKGMVIDGLDLRILADEQITGSFSMIGKSEESRDSYYGDGQPTPLTETPVLTGVRDVTAIFENGEVATAIEVQLQIRNNLRAKLEIGELGPSSIGQGKFRVSGKLRAHLATKTIMDRYLSAQETSLRLFVSTPSSGTYIIDLPVVKFTGGKRVAGGQNTDVIADLDFTASMDANRSLYITKFTKEAV